MNTVTFEGINFNADLCSTKTEKEFVEQSLKEGKYKNYKLDDRKRLLKEAYREIKLTVKPASVVPPSSP